MNRFIYSIVSNSLIKPIIVFESVPDVSDNSKAVFDEMVRRGLNKRYLLVWLINKLDSVYPNIRNVVYASKADRKRKWYIKFAKCYICCNGFVCSNLKEQKSFYLGHGMYVKKPTSYYSLPSEITYCFSSSTYLQDIQAKALNVPIEKMISLGYPRNDQLSNHSIDLNRIFNTSFSKFIIWYPTFRQHTSGMVTGSCHSIPILWNEENAYRINQCAKDCNTLIILKPHFAQDTSFIQKLKLSNLIIIDDAFFSEKGITSYQMLGNSDAMITDYSSVYFDYTLCDKPIGLIWEDFKEYNENPGFVLDMDFYMKGGVKIYSVEEFIQFIIDVYQSNDYLQVERREIRNLSNFSIDGKNSERVVDFIISKAGL